jgi:hypothetical protein
MHDTTMEDEVRGTGRARRWIGHSGRMMSLVMSMVGMLVVGLGFLAGCGPVLGDGEDEADDPDETWMLGVFDRRAVGDDAVYSVEFTPNGQAIWREISGCGRHEMTHDYTWSLLNSEELEVALIEDGSPYAVVRQVGCDDGIQKLVWETRQESPPVTFEQFLWRGERCLEERPYHPDDPDEPGEVLPGDVCEIVWCDEPPPPCEE